MLASVALPGQDARQQMGRSWGGEKLKGGKLSLVVTGSQPGSRENSTGNVQQWFAPHMHTPKSCPELLQQCAVTRHWFQWTNSCMFTARWQPWHTAILLLLGRLLLKMNSICCDTMRNSKSKSDGVLGETFIFCWNLPRNLAGGRQRDPCPADFGCLQGKAVGFRGATYGLWESYKQMAISAIGHHLSLLLQ